MGAAEQTDPAKPGRGGAEGGLDRKIRRRFFRDGRPRLFVDVGAARPDYLSMSASFRPLGWRVLAIEPNPSFAELHRALGHEVVEAACGDRDEDAVEFQIVNSHGQHYKGGGVSFESFSSFKIKDSFAALKPDLDATTIRVNVRRLDTILRTHAPDLERIGILSVDVEGWELEVLEGLSVDRYRPECVILENLFGDSAYREAMARRGYRLWRTVPPNDVYVPDATSLWPGESRALRLWDWFKHERLGLEE
jgi:FkbM family methyltransferase